MTWKKEDAERTIQGAEPPIGPPPFDGPEIPETLLNKTPREEVLDMLAHPEPIPGPPRVPYMIRREMHARGWVDDETWHHLRRLYTRGIPDT